MKHTSELKKSIFLVIGGIALGSIFSAGIFLSQKKKEAVDVSAIKGTPLFQLNGQTYTTTNLPAGINMEYYTLETNIFNARKSVVSQVAIRMALAEKNKKEGKEPTMTADTLPALVDLAPEVLVTEADAQKYFDSVIGRNKNAFGGQPFDAIKSRLQEQMQQQKMIEFANMKLQELEASGNMKFFVEAPVAPSVALKLAGYPSRGAATGAATQTFVEVADYMCPHCREAEPIVEKMVKDLAGKVTFVHVNYPLQPNGLSGALARGAFCANQQDKEKFWNYHKEAFQVPFEKMNPPNDKEPAAYFNEIAAEVAKKAQLDTDAFTKCLASKEAESFLASVESSFNAKTGMQGTPTFYFNNKLLAVSPEQLEKTIKVALEN